MLMTLAGMPVALQADFSTGFETSNGAYTAGSTVMGVDDTSAPGTNTWSAHLGSATPSAMIITNANPQSGTQALQINDTYSGAGLAFAPSINLTSAAANFSAPFKVSFGMNLQSVSAGTGNQIQMYFGAKTTDPGGTGGGRYWTGLLYNNGALNLLYDTSTTSIGNFNAGNYTTYSSLGNYVTFDITIDPVSKKYLGFVVTGANTTNDFTSSVSSLTLPWVPGSTVGGLVAGADPDYYLMFVTGSEDTALVNFDNFSISNVPEPTAWALVAASAVATLGYRLRRTRLG